jgi:hypothetical protein
MYLKGGASIDQREGTHEYPLFAAISGDSDVVTGLLLDWNADINTR